MLFDSKLIDDLARIASGAVGTVAGMRDEVEAQLRQQIETVLRRLDLVSREEFEAVRELAAQARQEQEALAERVAALEQRLQQTTGKARRAPGTGRTPRTRTPRTRKTASAPEDS